MTQQPDAPRSFHQRKADAAVRAGKVVDLTLAGSSNAQIAEAIGVDPTQVSKIRARAEYQEQYALALADLEEASRQRRSSINTKAWQVLEAALDGAASPIAAQTARWWVDRVEPVAQHVQQDVHLSGAVAMTHSQDLSRLDEKELRALELLVEKATPDDALPAA